MRPLVNILGILVFVQGQLRLTLDTQTVPNLDAIDAIGIHDNHYFRRNVVVLATFIRTHGSGSAGVNMPLSRESCTAYV